ncbi:hypothetical protein BH24ACT7_BH24ACT7_05510 [soil metagenome]
MVYPPRPLPDFVIIGAMKAGTTTLFHWLGLHPEVVLPKAKEPGFFARTPTWERGMDWYAGLFPERPPGFITGEASTCYLSPEYSAIAARRLRQTNPDVRLICMVRNPEDRLRSHYRHQVQRNRERRSLAEAVADPLSPYVAVSRYTVLLQPWQGEFPDDQLLVVALDDLDADGRPGWVAVLDHLGLGHVDPPGDIRNVTARKAQYTPLMQRIYDSPLRDKLGRLPRPVRGALRPLLLRNGRTVKTRYAESKAPLPGHVQEILAEENERLRRLLRRDVLPWEVDAAS